MKSGMKVGLIGKPDKGTVLLRDYDPRWTERFELQRKLISDVLGPTLVAIHHIGSTAVPGLAAKPIVDILVVVPDAADESSYVPPLEAVGYRLRIREPDFHQHRMLRSAPKDTHVHVFCPNSPEIERYLAFRDRLREAPQDRELYERTKRLLASKSWDDRNDYAEAKSEVVEQILRAALGQRKQR